MNHSFYMPIFCQYTFHVYLNSKFIQTRYGEISDVFLDGAKGEGEKDMKYLFTSWNSLIHQLQPGASIFSDLGPDTRWIGNEYGIADFTSWSLYNKTGFEIGDIDAQ